MVQRAGRTWASAVKAGQVLAQLDPQDLRLGQDAARAAPGGGPGRARPGRGRLQALQGAARPGLHQRGRTRAPRDHAEGGAGPARPGARAGGGAGQPGRLFQRCVADVAGVVTAVDAEPGMVLAAGAPVLRLAHDGPRDVVFAVPEDQVGRDPGAGRARPGASRCGPGATRRRCCRRTMREIAAAADPVTRTFLVKADIGNGAALRLGQTATVVVDAAAHRGRDQAAAVGAEGRARAQPSSGWSTRRR